MRHLLILCCVLLCSCATEFVAPEAAINIPSDRIYISSANPANSAKVVFTRDSGLFGSGAYQHLYINGVKAASFDPGEKLELNLTEGEYTFGVIPTDPFGTRTINGIDQNLKAGKSYFYRLQTDGSTYGMAVQRVIR